jgi:hypothetical protein
MLAAWLMVTYVSVFRAVPESAVHAFWYCMNQYFSQGHLLQPDTPSETHPRKPVDMVNSFFTQKMQRLWYYRSQWPHTTWRPDADLQNAYALGCLDVMDGPRQAQSNIGLSSEASSRRLLPTIDVALLHGQVQQQIHLHHGEVRDLCVLLAFQRSTDLILHELMMESGRDRTLCSSTPSMLMWHPPKAGPWSCCTAVLSTACSQSAMYLSGYCR